MQRSQDRILTTHVGSIVRPQAMLDLASFRAGPPKDPVQYEKIVREAVADVVRRQVAAGIDIVNDGEYGKSSWANYVLERISGFETRPGKPSPLVWLGRDRERFPELVEKEFGSTPGSFMSYVCTHPIEYQKFADIQRDAANLKAALAGTGATEGFLTVVAPASAVFNGVNEFYGNEREYIFALAEALRQEYLQVVNAGFVVQVDDAVLANMYDHLVRQSPEQYRQWAELRVEALNHALRDIPPEKVRYHVCFGSWHLPHTSDAPLEAIADLILQVRAGAYSLEAANPRHEHEWKVWKTAKLPDGKILIPGVISHSTVLVEHPELVAERIVRYANVVGRENVIAGTDCGFATFAGSKEVHPSIVWAKFKAMTDGARIASKELWG
jgi:5-methyltetrahydropteroyltriglutamate--homocysteine methyltransferase